MDKKDALKKLVKEFLYGKITREEFLKEKAKLIEKSSKQYCINGYLELQ